MELDMPDWIAPREGRTRMPGRPQEVPLEETVDLRQTDEIWECTVRRGRAWITPPDSDPYRPYLILIVSQDGRVLGSNFTEGKPTPSETINALTKAMRRPIPGSGRMRRPAVVHLDDRLLAEALTPELERVGVGCRYRHPLRQVERVLKAVEGAMGGSEAIPGLLETEGVSPSVIGGVFEAAAFFYDEAPWRLIDDSSPIEIRYPVPSPSRYAVVMGQGGVAYGLAIYDSTDVLRRTYAGTPPNQLVGQEEWTVLLFGQAMETPFDDLDAIEAHNWPVAGKHAYPLPVRAGLSGCPTRPDRSDLLRLEAALLALPRFVREHMRADEVIPRRAEATLTVTMAAGEDQIHLSYPVPDIEPLPDTEWTFLGESIDVRDRNAELLDAFERSLRDQGLSAGALQEHLDNVLLFAERYLAEEGGSLEISCPADEATLEDIDVFLSEWLLSRLRGALAPAVKAHMASLRRFYIFLAETGQLQGTGVDDLLTLLREDGEHYIEIARQFEEGLIDD